MLKKLVFICLFVPAFVFAQSKGEGGNYKAGIGFRAGYNPGLTFKYMMSSDAALEGIMQWRYRGFSVTGLYEIHKTAFGEPQLKWFYGIGGHVGFYGRGEGYGSRRGYAYDDSRPSIGIDGILGLEYVIQEIPFTVGLDFKPYIDIFYPGWGVFDGALSVRYIF